MGRSLSDCVVFARWCMEAGVDPVVAAELIRLSSRIGRAEDREDAVAVERLTKWFTDVATRSGFGVMWPGIYPVLTKDGNVFHIPDIL